MMEGTTNALHPDIALLQRLRQGDEGAMEKLFRTYYAPLYRFAYNMLRDKQQGEDAVQDVMTALWNKRDTLMISDSLQAYLYRAVRNNCLKLLQKNERKYWMEDSMEDDERFSTNDTVGTIDARELEGEIARAIDALPPRCGMVFKLSRFEEKSYKEIAETLEISVKTVEHQMGKALMLLRKHLSPYLTAIVLGILWLLNN